MGNYPVGSPLFIVHLSLLSLLNVKASNFFSQDNISETDIMLKLWFHLVDLQFMSSTKLRCYRGEITSKTSATRRAARTVTSPAAAANNRKPMGHRGDLLIRSNSELAYGEASTLSSAAAQKNLIDSQLKTSKAMKDMLGAQFEAVDYDLGEIKSLGQLVSSSLVSFYYST